jgi:AcrR family transcriptional regulator
LPPGPHGIPPELIERNQRERLIAAMAEVCAERGYAESSVAEVAKRAGVSTASFYRQFKDKRECMLASFAELFERLLAAIEAGCREGEGPEERARTGIGTAIALLGADPPAARLLSIEIVAVGPEGVRAQHDAIERLAGVLRGAEAPGAPDAVWAATAAMTALLARRLVEDRIPDAAEFESLLEVL